MTDVAVVNKDELALIAAQDAEFGDEPLVVPILKVAQSLTKEVQEGEADPGEFINTLLGVSLGDTIGFIVAYYEKGRSFANRETNKYSTAPYDIIPESWEDIVGVEFVGTRFDEHPDAEEQYKIRVDAGEIPWGKGPPITTTHNYTGLAVVSPPEGSDEPDDYQPVRLSLARAQMEAVRKINSIKRMTLRGKPFYDSLFTFTTYRKTYTSGPTFVVRPSVERPTTPEERQQAHELALAVVGGRVEAAEAALDAEAPKAEGALDV